MKNDWLQQKTRFPFSGRSPGGAGFDGGDGTSPGKRADVTIIIKTLNEESNIARAIESALAALEGLGGEVIVADSLSQDRTVEIAASYPVTVVQLRHAKQRRCGVGPQLGFQFAHGEFLYILDGDMELDPDFIGKAVRFLREHPDVVGVAGIVEELGGGNYEFEARKSQLASWSMAGVQHWLDMGGLYRRTAVERAGYFSNRNLHACEEQELGLRLTHLGGRLVRLPSRSVRHHGRRESSWALMKRRLATRYSDGPGELVRAAIGESFLWQALRSHLKLAAMAGLWLATAGGLALLPWSRWPLSTSVTAFLTLALLMLLRKRNFSQTAEGLMNWQLRTAGFVRGLLTPQIPPTTWIESRIVSTPEARIGETAPPVSDRGKPSHAHQP